MKLPRTQPTALLALLLLGAGCGMGVSREGGLKAVTRDLEEAKVLELLRVDITDRESSALYRFKTDRGRLIDVKAVASPSQSPGAPRAVGLRISPHTDQYESELEAGTPVEQRLLQLLESCAVASADPGEPGRPTRDRVEWLRTRIKDRSLKWSSAP